MCGAEADNKAFHGSNEVFKRVRLSMRSPIRIVWSTKLSRSRMDSDVVKVTNLRLCLVNGVVEYHGEFLQNVDALIELLDYDFADKSVVKRSGKRFGGSTWRAPRRFCTLQGRDVRETTTVATHRPGDRGSPTAKRIGQGHHTIRGQRSHVGGRPLRGFGGGRTPNGIRPSRRCELARLGCGAGRRRRCCHGNGRESEGRGSKRPNRELSYEEDLTRATLFAGLYQSSNER